MITTELLKKFIIESTDIDPDEFDTINWFSETFLVELVMEELKTRMKTTLESYPQVENMWDNAFDRGFKIALEMVEKYHEALTGDKRNTKIAGEGQSQTQP